MYKISWTRDVKKLIEFSTASSSSKSRSSVSWLIWRRRDSLCTAEFSSDNLNSILGDVSAATNISDIGWIGSLNQIDRVSGYWLKLDNSDMVEYEAHPHGQHIISMDK